MRNAGGTIAYIGLGANLGDRQANISAALDLIRRQPEIEVLRISGMLENPSVGGPPDSPPYLNAAAKIQTTLGSHALLHRLMDVEKQLRRFRRIKWEPRTIDLDILLFGDQIISSHELVVPHPLMHERIFVLIPLAEIAPEAVHPTLQMTIAGLLEDQQQKLGKEHRPSPGTSSRFDAKFE